jgi:hypothetical protein
MCVLNCVSEQQLGRVNSFLFVCGSWGRLCASVSTKFQQIGGPHAALIDLAASGSSRVHRCATRRGDGRKLDTESPHERSLRVLPEASNCGRGRESPVCIAHTRAHSLSWCVWTVSGAYCEVQTRGRGGCEEPSALGLPSLHGLLSRSRAAACRFLSGSRAGHQSTARVGRRKLSARSTPGSLRRWAACVGAALRWLL